MVVMEEEAGRVSTITIITTIITTQTTTMPTATITMGAGEGVVGVGAQGGGPREGGR